LDVFNPTMLQHWKPDFVANLACAARSGAANGRSGWAEVAAFSSEGRSGGGFSDGATIVWSAPPAAAARLVQRDSLLLTTLG
jgi:hypothetical protein